MRILLADDEQLALENLEELVREAAPGAFVHSFRKVKELYSRSQLSQIHTFIAEIRNALSHAGHRDVLVKKRNSVAINVEAVDCDYYRFLQGDIRAINSFTGEYMNNYSWAEFTVGSLSLISARQRTIIKPAGGSEFLKTL